MSISGKSFRVTIAALILLASGARGNSMTHHRSIPDNFSRIFPSTVLTISAIRESGVPFLIFIIRRSVAISPSSGSLIMRLERFGSLAVTVRVGGSILLYFGTSAWGAGLTG